MFKCALEGHGENLKTLRKFVITPVEHPLQAERLDRVWLT